MSLSKSAGQLEGGDQSRHRQSLLLDVNLFIKAASPSFYSVFHVTPGELLGTKLADLGNGQWNDAELLQMLKEGYSADNASLRLMTGKRA